MPSPSPPRPCRKGCELKIPESEALKAIDYLYREGFLVLGYRDGEPAVFLATDLREAQRAMKAVVREDPADWWKSK